MSRKATIVLSIDGLSASLPGPYGNTTVDTPALNRLASVSRLYDFCFARSPDPQASRLTMWSALQDFEGHRTLMTDSREAAGHAHESAFFESIETLELAQPIALAASIAETSAADFFAHAVEKANGIQGGDVLWLHHRGLFGPWDAPLELRMQFADEEDPDPPTEVSRPQLTLEHDVDPDLVLGFQQSAYGQLAVIDALLELFLQQLAAMPGAEDVQLVVVSPRGYPLGEHGLVGIPNLHGESIHVPFFHCPSLNPQGGSPGGSRTGEMIFVEQAMHRILGGQWPENPLMVATLGNCVATLNESWKLIYDRDNPIETSQLFVRPDDRWEVNNVSRRCRDVAEDLLKRAGQLLAKE